MLARGRIHELPGRAGRCEADEERPPPRTVDVAGGPVPPLLAALREIVPADFFGARAERGSDAGGGAHGAHLGRERGPAEPGL